MDGNKQEGWGPSYLIGEGGQVVDPVCDIHEGRASLGERPHYSVGLGGEGLRGADLGGLGYGGPQGGGLVRDRLGQGGSLCAEWKFILVFEPSPRRVLSINRFGLTIDGIANRL